MDRVLTPLLIVAAVAAAPAAALAQTWPAGVVSGGPQMAAGPARTFVVINRDARLQRRPDVPPTEPRVAPLRLSSAEEVPEVDIRSKEEWRDDEGFRVAPTRVAFKRRF